MQGQDQGQNQGQSQGQEANNAQMQGQTANQGNAQQTSITFNSKAADHVQVRTNTPVGLTASSSFSSDYCGGTMSGGASAAPIGISIGASGPKYDRSCQALRRAEKFGMAAANEHNMGQPEMAHKLMSMMIWSICMSDTTGPASGTRYPDGRVALDPTIAACMANGLVGAPMSAANDPAPMSPPPANASVAKTADAHGKVTPEAANRALAMTQPTVTDTRAAQVLPH
jgi:hypothetical protein